MTLATSFRMVNYRNVTYLPTHVDTGDWSVTPDNDHKMWAPLGLAEVQRVANKQFDLLFRNERELVNFAYMVQQAATEVVEPVNSLLLKTAAGLRVLLEDGSVVSPNGTFVPNCLPVPVNDDRADKDYVMSVLVEWLGSEESARSLLYHLATALAPGWSAVRYVLLIGNGRNGKSLLMSMVERMFGSRNCSSVSRQDISEKSPVVTELNGKLVNIIYDGVASYLKDSGMEKSLIAGEPVAVRKLYQSEATPVQTNALFIEGLNKEPKSSDKSSALQTRLSRFWFPNQYEDDLSFREQMLSDQMVGALLSLMIDHYVRKEEKAARLALTQESKRLKLDHMHANSLALQFLVFSDEHHPLGVGGLVGLSMDEVATAFLQWRLKENDLTSWSRPDIAELFRPVLLLERKSRRVNGKPRKVQEVKGFHQDAVELLEMNRGEADVVVD
jgi:hypothetical protein